MKLSKKLVLPFLGIVTCFSAAVGATYALFTSNVNTDITITAGKVSFSSSLTGLELYSASLTDDDSTGVVLPGSNDPSMGQHAANYYHVKQDGSFSNGGTGTLVGGDLTLTNMSAGDMAKATLNILNSSNVKVKYRLIAECLNEDESSLRFFANLEFNALGEELTSVRKFVTKWMDLDEGEAVASTPVSVYLPLISKMQDNGCNIRFSVEAVQANAYTLDEDNKYYIEFHDESVIEDPSNPGQLEDLMFYYYGPSVSPSDPNVVVSLPASEGTIKAYTELNEEPIIIGDMITCRITELADDEPGTIVVGAEEVAVNYDISLYNQNEEKIKSTSENIKVYVYVGSGLDILEVVHNGVSVVEGVQAEGEYYQYDSASGFITVTTNKFSPFSVKWKAPIVLEGDGTEQNPYMIFDYDTMCAVETYSKASDEYLYFKVKDGVTEIDLNQDSRNWNGIYLKGQFDGNGVTFKNADDSVFYKLDTVDNKPVVLKDFVVDTNITTNDEACAVAYWTKAPVYFDNVDVLGYLEGSGWTCSYISWVQCGPTGDVIFKDCLASETIVCTSGQCSGFVGHASYPSKVNSLQFINSKYTGNMTSTAAYNCRYNTTNYLDCEKTIFDEASTVPSTWWDAEQGSYVYKAEGKVGILQSKPLSLPSSLGDKFVIDAVEGAVKATYTLIASPNGPNESGCFVGNFIYEEVLPISGKFTSNDIIRCEVKVNREGIEETGLHGNIYDIVGACYGHTIYYDSSIKVVQYDANGSVLCVSYVSLEDKA